MPAAKRAAGHNPLKIDLMAIKDIVVEETIEEGKSIYRKG